MADRGAAWLGQEFIAAWNAHDIDRIAALYAPDFDGTDVGDATPQHGPDSARRSAEQYVRAFPDLRLTVDDLVLDGNRLVLLWTACGTHQETVMHIPPTHRTVQVRGACLLVVEGEQIRRAVHIWDVAAMLRGLGLLPELHVSS
ncbi:MAG TPA: ester cyclase [Chloroflexota bacterium]|nr:ester cyclase [Chloroflexota bacterium]